ncbi:MAG: hypothetical protein HMLKMBBP_00698 [Planctomycetes bacterium]|nr:hypothetical protein [Planctomycetota bacterium]
MPRVTLRPRRARRAAALLCLALAPLGAATRGAAAWAEDAGAGPEGDAFGAVVGKRRRPGRLQVRRIKPRDGKQNVDVDAAVVVAFNAPIDPSTLTSQTVRLQKLNGEQVRHERRIEEDGKVLVLEPEDGFEPATDYHVRILPGVADAAGRTLRRERSAIFFTDPGAPTPLLLPSQFVTLEDTMAEPRAAHSATVTTGGRVVIVGGQTDGVVFASSVEIFDPDTLRFQVLSASASPRAYHASVGSVNDVWAIGGWNGTAASSSTTHVNGLTWQVTTGPAMLEERDFAAAAPLPNGKVLVTGGLRYSGSNAFYSDTAEILELGTFRTTFGRPVRRRAGHSLTPLPDGRVLVVGGVSAQSGFPATAEIFDPVSELFTTLPEPALYHRQIHNATALQGGGLVLVTDGGNSLAEVFDAATGKFSAAGGGSFVSRTRAGTALLPDGRVLIVGGLSQQGATTLILDAVDLYDPRYGDWGRIRNAGVKLDPARAGHTVTALRSGQVLIAGGFEPTGLGGDNLASAVLFTPEEE